MYNKIYDNFLQKSADKTKISCLFIHALSGTFFLFCPTCHKKLTAALKMFILEVIKPVFQEHFGGIEMMGEYPSWPLILFMAFCNAFLTAGRTALTQLPDAEVKKLAASERKRDRRIAHDLEKPAALLEGCKLAGFSCTVVTSLLLWSYLARSLSALFPVDGAPVFLRYTAVFLACAVQVLILDVLCLLLPYRIACRHPQPVAAALAGFCRTVSLLFRPFVAFNGTLAELLARLVGCPEPLESGQAAEEEIRMMVDVGSEKGEIEQSEKEMINNIFEFDDRCVSEVMTHRTDMCAIPKTATLSEVAALALESGYSRIPVYDDNVDAILGIVYVKDLLRLIEQSNETFDPQSYMRPALFVPETMSCVDLFSQFKAKKVQVAIVVDEYGGTAGIASMEDLLESIVGNIQDEYDDEEEEIFKLGEDCYAIGGTVLIDDVERLFGITLAEDSEYDTIGGLLTDVLERIPAPGEHPTVALGEVKFTVVAVSDRRIVRIRAERSKTSAPS